MVRLIVEDGHESTPFQRIANMAEITAALVKELRERTGQGMMECKKALVAANGDIEKAIDDMRASGAIKAAKKAGNIAAEGSIAVKVRSEERRVGKECRSGWWPEHYK